MGAARRRRISRNARHRSARLRLGPRANPPADEMHAYDTKDLERLFGLPASAVRTLARAGNIQPGRRSGRLHYSVPDLVGLRPAHPVRATTRWPWKPPKRGAGGASFPARAPPPPPAPPATVTPAVAVAVAVAAAAAATAATTTTANSPPAFPSAAAPMNITRGRSASRTSIRRRRRKPMNCV